MRSIERFGGPKDMPARAAGSSPAPPERGVGDGRPNFKIVREMCESGRVTPEDDEKGGFRPHAIALIVSPWAWF